MIYLQESNCKNGQICKLSLKYGHSRKNGQMKGCTEKRPFSLCYVQDIYSNCYKSAIELNQVKEGRKRGRVEKEHGN